MVPLVSATPVRNVRRRSMMLRMVNTPTLTMSTGWMKSCCKLPTFSTRQLLSISCALAVETVMMMMVMRKTQLSDILISIGRCSLLSSVDRILLRNYLIAKVRTLNYYGVNHMTSSFKWSNFHLIGSRHIPLFFT